MHAELARQLRCRLLAATRRQCHFRLERSAKIPSLPSHPSEPPDRPPHSGDSTPYQGAQFLGSTSSKPAARCPANKQVGLDMEGDVCVVQGNGSVRISDRVANDP